MSGVEEGVLVHCADAFQYGPTSVSSAGAQPARLRPPPLARLYLTSTAYVYSEVYHFPRKFARTHKHSPSSVSVCVCVCGFSVPRGPQSQPSHSVQLTALSTLSVHLSLCSPLPLSSCSRSRPISQPSTHS